MISKKLAIVFAVACVSGSPAWSASPQDMMKAYAALSGGDYSVAIPALRRLADQGDAQSQSTLATIYWNGAPGVPADRTAALDYYQRAASKLNGAACAALGNIYLKGESVPMDYKKAFEYLNQAVSQGTSHGKIGLAVCYLKGWGTEQDLKKSFQLTREAAMQRVPGAAFNAAYYYRKGIGTPVDLKEANAWFAQAAPLLIAEAARQRNSYEHQIAVGTMYQNGWGVPKDPKRAAQYFTFGLPLLNKAVAAGKTNALLTLAELRENGWGVNRDAAGATQLIQKAASMGDKEADWMLAQRAPRPAAETPEPVAAPPSEAK
jgi:uncharacterized protein